VDGTQKKKAVSGTPRIEKHIPTHTALFFLVSRCKGTSLSHQRRAL